MISLWIFKNAKREGKKCQQRPSKQSVETRAEAERCLCIHIECDLPTECHSSPQQPWEPWITYTQVCFYAEEQNRGVVISLDYVRESWLDFRVLALSIVPGTTQNVKWLLQTFHGLECCHPLLCRRNPSVTPRAPTGDWWDLRFHICHWWALDLRWVKCALSRILPYMSCTQLCGIWIPSPSLFWGKKTKQNKTPNRLYCAPASGIGMCICIPSNLCVCKIQTGKSESLWLWKHDFEQLSGGKKNPSPHWIGLSKTVIVQRAIARIHVCAGKLAQPIKEQNVDRIQALPGPQTDLHKFMFRVVCMCL